MNDENERSVASAGSVVRRELRVPGWRGVPVDLWIDADGDLGVVGAGHQVSVVIHRDAIPAIAAWLGSPALTDEERDAVNAAVGLVGTQTIKATLRGLLERLK